jgi:hypothetical protein
MRPIYQIYIEEQLIDIDPKTIIALTLQAADFASGNISSRKASYTNQIKVPASNNNIRIFEYANNPKSGSSFPYIKKSIKILSNGLQILEGITIIKSFDTYFNLQIYSLNKDLNFRISNIYLSDLDFGDSAITWDNSFIDTKRASTTGWCAPLMNYGQMYKDINPYPYIGGYYLPSISYKDIITTILTNAGYTISGTFYTSDYAFNNTVLTYSKNTFPSGTIKMNDVLSTTILQSDFLQDFLIRFGAAFDINNNNIEIITYESILTNTSNAIDWTNKRVKNKRDIIQYNWGSLAQMNNFLYNDVDISSANIGYDNVTFLNPNGSLIVGNENLQNTSDVYTSLFERPNVVIQNEPGSVVGNRVEVATYGGVWNCVTSNVYKTLPSSFVFDTEPVPIIALLCDIDAGELSTCIYGGSARTDFKVARFSGINYLGTAIASQPISMAWTPKPLLGNIPGMLDTYYASFQRLFTDGLIVTTHEYNLTDLDINNLDLLTPIFDDGNYYLINKVNSYVSYKTTRVELLKI